MMTTKIIRARSLPSPKTFVQHSLLIYDRKLIRNTPHFSRWLRRWNLTYPVTAGEALKSVETFPRHIRVISKRCRDIPRSELVIVAVGGGSVCDFSGFVASIVKRGVRLILIPSTWLAALDAAHGGKTALNVSSAKNQIGTYYPASHIYLVKQLLDSQPSLRAKEALAELVKIAAIDGGPWTRRLWKSRLLGADLCAAFLMDAVKSKLRIVKEDPEERSGIRQVLNLGHTMGHVFEASFGWSHGFAIARGLEFALGYSEVYVGLKPREADLIRQVIPNGDLPPRRKISLTRFQQLLARDKKCSGRMTISFVFLKRIGRPVRKSVPFNEIVTEAKRQGWVIEKSSHQR